MKKLPSFLLIVALGCFAIGCSGDPGVSIDTDVTVEEEEANMDAADPTAGLEEGEDAAGEATP